MQVLLIEDHALLRDGVTLILQELDADIHIICGESAAQAEELATATEDLDLVLLDYHLKDSNAFDCLSNIQKRHPGAPIIILSAERSRDLIQKSLEYGAKGFITKTSSSQVMLSAIQLVLAGGIYVPPEILEASGADPDSTPEKQTELSVATAPLIPQKPSSLKHHLTVRQLEVIAHMAQGQSNKEIARSLNMSPSTVKVHVSAILKEFEVKNRTQAVNIAIHEELIPNNKLN